MPGAGVGAGGRRHAEDQREEQGAEHDSLLDRGNGLGVKKEAVGVGKLLLGLYLSRERDFVGFNSKYNHDKRTGGPGSG